MESYIVESNLTIEELVKKIENNEIGLDSIPFDKRMNEDVLRAERKVGLRVSMKRGFDVIKNKFFVEEFIPSYGYIGESKNLNINYFDDFDSYYSFLSGDIYENACYYGYQFGSEVKKYNLNLNKLNNAKFKGKTIDDYNLETVKVDFKSINKDKRWRKNWLTKLSKCKTYEQFECVWQNLLNGCIREKDFGYNVRFFLYAYMTMNHKKAFDIMMHYIANSNPKMEEIAYAMGFIYDAKTILEKYSYETGCESTKSKHKNQIKKMMEFIEQGNYDHKKVKYYDDNSGYYCVENQIYSKGTDKIIFKFFQYYETFEFFVRKIGKDLTNCDLSTVILVNVDFSKYKVDDTTILPIGYNNNYSYEVKKKYDRFDDCFYVTQTWKNYRGIILKEYNHKFKFFVEFVIFLKNDLSNADLLFCDGIGDLPNLEGFNWDGAILRSEIKDKLGIKYNKYKIERLDDKPSDIVKSNELISLSEFEKSIEIRAQYNKEMYGRVEISYISDLHLMHRIVRENCKTYDDVYCVVQKIVDRLVKDTFKETFLDFVIYKDVLLIGGDVSSEYSVFEMFVKLLNEAISKDILVIFVLGNHEMWGQSNLEFSQMVDKYNNLLKNYNMYLLQNNLIIKKDDIVEEISEEELYSLSDDELRKITNRSRLIFFGGVGFAGYNDKFNANSNIYRGAITREEEINESRIIDELYNKVCKVLYDKNVIVFTHFPKNDWSQTESYQSGFVYVSGHTHRNYFYDNGEYRIFADNQVGYTQKNYFLKTFKLDDSYDYFLDYDDGIYNIDREQYLYFYRGINTTIDLNWDVVELFMLKKNGYYCFIHKSKTRNLSILNGGQRKKLIKKDIQYYYDNMDQMIDLIKKPLAKYSKVQQIISDEIKSIGGYGDIHGCIVDIDFNNHIYVNPQDLTITPYWAADMIEKKAYANIGFLLEDQNEKLYLNYQKLIEGKGNQAFLPQKTNNKLTNKRCEYYYSTDIYSASILLNKMQRLNSKILTVWIEPPSDKDKNKLLK